MVKIKHLGKFFNTCKLNGETSANNRFIGHTTGIQVSKDRFLLIGGTRSFRGIDDNRSIIYQLRKDSYDGLIIREGFFAQSDDQWQALNDGRHFIMAHLHPVVFGVPKGTIQNGTIAPHANVFVALWARMARFIDKDTSFLIPFSKTSSWLEAPTQSVQSLQFRLNDKEDDLEIIQKPKLLQQKGFENGYTFCDAKVHFMIQSYIPPIPFNENSTEWIGYNYFDNNSGPKGKIAAMRYTFNPKDKMYEWTQTGPLIGNALLEPSVVRWKNHWVISARIDPTSHKGQVPTAWMKIEDPFQDKPDIIFPKSPLSRAPVTTFSGADGKIRCFTTDPSVSPYHSGRDPLYMWEINPESEFSASNCQTVFDCKASNLPIREESGRIVDQARLLPHTGGEFQYILHRVRPISIDDPNRKGVAVNQKEKNTAGIYCAKLYYSKDYPAPWKFGEKKGAL